MSLSFEPIGYIKSTYTKKYEAPRQAHIEEAESGKIILNPQQNFETALHDLDGFSHIWLLYHFHLNRHWKPKVLPPRNTRTKRGLFATRSPYRPNPIGMTVVRLEKISGRTLHIHNHDLLDNTPILDIKPYLTYCDSHKKATEGWLRSIEEKTFNIIFSETTENKLDWLSNQNISFKHEIIRRLCVDPFPHPYRRITKFKNHYQMRYKEWCIDYLIHQESICVFRVYSGFTKEKQAQLKKPNLHEKFLRTFSSQQ